MKVGSAIATWSGKMLDDTQGYFVEQLSNPLSVEIALDTKKNKIGSSKIIPNKITLT